MKIHKFEPKDLKKSDPRYRNPDEYCCGECNEIKSDIYAVGNPRPHIRKMVRNEDYGMCGECLCEHLHIIQADIEF